MRALFLYQDDSRVNTPDDIAGIKNVGEVLNGSGESE